MIADKKMSAASRIKSFSFASNGLFLLLKGEPNMRLHALATIIAIVAGAVRHLAPWQWAAMAFAIGIVWISEALNTCIEKLCDLCCDNKFHPAVKIIKDIAAAAVLIAAVVSVATGIIIFLF